MGQHLPPPAPFLGSHLMQQQQLQQQTLQQSSLNPAARSYQQGSGYSLPAMSPQPSMQQLLAAQQQQQQQQAFQPPLGPQQLLHPSTGTASLPPYLWAVAGCDLPHCAVYLACSMLLCGLMCCTCCLGMH